MEEKQVSFIIPVYNAEKYIEKCIKSIENQGIDNYEIIIVNDGSQDRSLDVCEKCKKENENILIETQENRGQGAARNRGIELARGKWICFVDNDDWLEYGFLREYQKYFDTDIDILLFAKRDVYGKKTKEYLLNADLYFFEGEAQTRVLQLSTLNFFYDEIGKLPLGTPWGKLIKARLLKEKNIRFVESYGEDRPCMFALYGEAQKILAFNKIFYNYSVHESAMRKYLPNAVKEYEKSLLAMHNIVDMNYFNDESYLVQLRQFDVAWFSYCVMQDFCNKDNQQSYQIRKRRFFDSLKERYYKDAFSNTNFAGLPLRRRILAVLIKYRCFALMDVMSRLNDLYIKIQRGI